MSVKPRDIVDLIRSRDIRMVEFRYTDIRGVRQQTTVPADAVDEEMLAAGVRLDASRIRGVPALCESGALLKPDLDTATVDGFRAIPTLSIVSDIWDAASRAPYADDPRAVARRAEAFLTKSGIADALHFAPLAQFTVLAEGAGADDDDASFDGSEIDADLLAEMALNLKLWGVEIEMLGHDGGHAQLDMRAATLRAAADRVVTLKDVVKRTAARYGAIATFMPKPVFGESGNAMHLRQSLWKGAKPLFHDARGYAECSQMMLWYIGGLLTHIDSLLAVCAPSTNSYRRLAPHGDASLTVAFSSRSASAAIGIPAPAGDPKQQRLEFRAADATANPYLAFAALACAGVDGIKRKIDPVKAGFGPLDRPLGEIDPAAAANLRSAGHTLADALAALAGDHEYLTANGVFGRAFIGDWIARTTEHDVRTIAARPHPHEIALYFDV